MGWKFPLQVTACGSVALSIYEQRVQESVYLILSTAKGERLMLPDFGCGIHDLVFAPNDPTTAGLIQSHVMEALGRWEPRIDVVSVDVRNDWDDEGQVLIEIRYVIKATNADRNLVYPFYLIPGED